MNDESRKKPFAKKSFGQNFLIDQSYIARIIKAVAPTAGETIFEIGPGRGALSARLLDREAEVIAVELDRDMIAILGERFANNSHFHLIAGDVLKLDFETSAGEFPARTPAKLVANLPYYISTAILQRLIEERIVFSQMVLMFQREVVERITAPPGSSERGFLTVLVEAFLTAERLFDVPPSAFRPAPKVWSSVVRFTPKADVDAEFNRLYQLASIAFAQKRKTIYNNLRSAYPEAKALLEDAGIEPSRRAETLTSDEWIRLAESVSN